MKRRHAKLRRRYGRARWTPGDVQRLLDVPASQGEVIVFHYPHFTEAVVAPAHGTSSSEMAFYGNDRDVKARDWSERQAKRFLGVAI